MKNVPEAPAIIVLWLWSSPLMLEAAEEWMEVEAKADEAEVRKRS